MTPLRGALAAAWVAAVVVGLMLALAAAVRWWQGEPMGWLDWIALAALPLLAWVYVTKVSVFRPGGRCVAPPGGDHGGRGQR
jgi:hypothetical protein